MTLMELVVVLIILGVIAVVAIPRLTNMTALRDRGEYDRVVSTLQYARQAALAQRRYACLDLTSTTVTLTIDPNPPELTAIPFGGTCANALPLLVPDKAPCGTNQLCLTTTTLTASAGSFKFDAQGRASATVTLTVSGFPVITVEGETGYVH